MPLPKPRKRETHDDFISRCMANPTMNTDFKDQGQRYAVCQRQWDSVHGAEATETAEDPAPTDRLKPFLDGE